MAEKGDSNGTSFCAQKEKTYPVNRPPGMAPRPPGFNPKRPPVFKAPNRSTCSSRRRRRWRCCLLCFWTFALFFSIIIIAVTLAGILGYYLLKPKEPNFSVSNVILSQLNVTTHLSSELVMTMEARNPNRHISFMYEHSSVSMLYHSSATQDDVLLGSGKFPLALLGKRSKTIVKIDLKSDTKNSISESTGDDLRSSVRKKKMGTKVEIETHMRVILDNFKFPKIKMNIECLNVALGKQNKNSKCNINIFKLPWHPFK